MRPFDSQSARRESRSAPPFSTSPSCTRMSDLLFTRAASTSFRQFGLKKSAPLGIATKTRRRQSAKQYAAERSLV
eukprot:4420985-Prymnesium_polylepis.1